MHIPDVILEKGGSHLDNFVKTKRELDKVKKEIDEIWESVEESFVSIEKLIGDYFRKGKPISDYSYFHDMADKKNGTSFCRGVDPLQNVYATEELLKNIRDFTLDERAARFKEKKLENDIRKLMDK